ncbi:MAG TPA: deoxyribodipyrimidine photo-lyase, partial [Candidatus Paceibacterota bacterium]
MVDTRRTRARNDRPVNDGAVVYWMQRDQRVSDNWALLYAQKKALERSVPLLVLFNLVPTFGKATLRQYDFMLKGLGEVEQKLQTLNIPFIVVTGEPDVTIPEFVKRNRVGEVVVDFNPLRFVNQWRTNVADALSIAFTEVDAHNIVPCWEASHKQEFAAYTIRPKIQRKLTEFLTPFPAL